MKKLWLVLIALLLATGLSLAQNGVKKIRPAPQNYGKVVLNRYSEAARLAPVIYDHWLHRAKYTCRLCHVDLGFAMAANQTDIRAADNLNGNYCGSCHNGKSSFEGQKIFAACEAKTPPQDTATKQRCVRCHAQGQGVTPQNDFAAFTEKFHRVRFGNGVDWMQTESAGLVKLIDRLDGVSAKGKPFLNPVDSTIAPHTNGMPDIVFSHDKHAVWNGCELCHPDLFPSVEKNKAHSYSMNEIFDGKYCGVCHGKVSFPMIECQKCHSKPVTP
ncbi:MAG: hypothetical protein COY49_01565 [Comamonadaceae bacterium CG_4_10_14_0_8_um_filter_57_29]|nr:MAG: hypothetical protein COY49_01565 [Comamonadaceae bacterium CG_4_10_14_0_8_um_filter_57_29]